MNDREVGVGPHSPPWPIGGQFDEDLLQSGDRRNVEDRYRYWKNEAIKTDMQRRSFELEIAIENYQHDFNIGTIVRNANAFNVRKVHIIGRRQWNKRGAMVTNRYLDVVYHKTIGEFREAVKGKTVVAVDNKPGALALSSIELPADTVLVFGGEGPGLSDEMVGLSEFMVAIEQFGSTRSINVGVASGVVIYKWLSDQGILIK